ncbi:nucleotidyltransferase [Blastococcus sp. CCUG 61487]|nr:nucleotidyltransferase [Blastococcus sp. CCUG 61487]
MNVSSAFQDFQTTVNASDEQVADARERRNLFNAAFGGEQDVDKVIPSGSLARGTQKDPIHDVDTIIVFKAEEHPEWGSPGSSAEDALNHTQQRVNALLGGNGTHEAGRVRYTRWRNHAVKCWLDPTDDPDAFTVDAMPALKRNGHLLVPEAVSEKWIECDPEYLIAAVKQQHSTWNKFAGSVRMVKAWAAEQQGVKIKSLVMEVLALDLMPLGKTQPVAIKEFFVKAAALVEAGLPIDDPADLCGPIQPDLDYALFADRLRSAADDAGAAIAAQVNNNEAKAIKLWGDVFGSSFPSPPASAGTETVAAPRTVKDNPQG